MNRNCEPNGFKISVEDYRNSNKNRLEYMNTRVLKSYKSLAKKVIKPSLFNLYNLFGTPSYEDILEDLLNGKCKKYGFRYDSDTLMLIG